MAAEEAAVAEEEAEAAVGEAPRRRPPSTTPIPDFDMDVLLETLTTSIGDEEANSHVRQVELPATATAAQRRRHEENYVLSITCSTR